MGKFYKRFFGILMVLTMLMVSIVPIQAHAFTKENNITPKIPVILLHGRGDNSSGCFGAINRVTKGDLKVQEIIKGFSNDGYSTDNKRYIKDLYSNVFNQEIQEIIEENDDEKFPYNLAYELESQGYEKNKTLFVFNYPNMDFVKENAEILKLYIENLYKAYGYTQFDLVGHSKGGLVSRYYIENLEGRKNIRKLITINTPHWGSFPAYASFVKEKLRKLPCDVDLQPDSRLYGGNLIKMLCNNDEREKYINNPDNQSLALDYAKKENVEYYAIAGINYWNKEIELRNDSKTIIDIDTNNFTLDNVNESLDKWDKMNNLNYDNNKKLLSIKLNFDDFSFINPFNTLFNSISEAMVDKALSFFNDLSTQSLGDDVVNLKSQIGYRNGILEKGKAKIVPMKKISININPVRDHLADHNLATNFHTKNQHTKPVSDKVIEYLNDGTNTNINENKNTTNSIDVENINNNILNNTSQFVVKGNELYYSDILNDHKLYKINLDGTNKKMLINDITYVENIAIDNDYIYFKGLGKGKNNSGHGIFRCKTNGESLELLGTGVIEQFYLKDEWIYLSVSDSSIGAGVFKVKKDGSNSERIKLGGHWNKYGYKNFIIYDNKIYGGLLSGGMGDQYLHGINMDGKDSKLYQQSDNKYLDMKIKAISDDWIYFYNSDVLSSHYGDLYKIHKDDKDGSTLTKIYLPSINNSSIYNNTKNESTPMCVENNWIYYISNGSIYKVKTDGTEQKKLVGNVAWLDQLYIYGDWIYYYTRTKNNLAEEVPKIYRMKKDGSERQEIKNVIVPN